MNETVTIETVRPAAESFANYLRAKVENFDSLSANEIVEATFAFHAEWQSSPERKAERAEKRLAREAEAEKARADREAKRAARDEAKREEILAAAKRLGIVPSDVVSDAKKK
jgi:hypothetical protein